MKEFDQQWKNMQKMKEMEAPSRKYKKIKEHKRKWKNIKENAMKWNKMNKWKAKLKNAKTKKTWNMKTHEKINK